MDTVTLQYRPTRRNDEVVIDNRTLREKLVDLKCKLVGAVQSAWTATKDFFLGRPGIQREVRKAKWRLSLALLATILGLLAAWISFFWIYVVLIQVSIWLGLGWLVLGIFLMCGGFSIITA